MPENQPLSLPIIENSPRFALDDRFTFQCGPHLECFTQCCQDVSILLTPYDVLRMKKALGLDSSEFLEKYTVVMQGKEKPIPTVFLKMDAAVKCPFVNEKGCAIYAHRPWACRMYPLGMAEPTDPQAAAQRFYFLVQEAICKGHGVGNEGSVRDWIDQQGIEIYDLNQGAFRQLLANPGWEKPELLTADKLAMFYMAAYDLDRFRRFVFETRFLELFEVDEARAEAIWNDDEELLEFAMDWVAFCLFHEKRKMKLTRHASAKQETSPATAANVSV